jgi:hypothetical protein
MEIEKVRISASKPRFWGILRSQSTAPAVGARSWSKISFDVQTASIVAKACQPGYDETAPGLINMATGEMHLLENAYHEKIALNHDLIIIDIENPKKSLKPGWFGFFMFPSEGKLIISPESTQFGAMPIEYAPLFESSMKALLSERGFRGPILFAQFNYQRTIPKEKLESITTLGNKKMPTSLSDAELLERYPFLR